MRTLVLIVALLWGGASWWWYTCNIKGYCGNTEATTTIAATQVDDKPAPESHTSATSDTEGSDQAVNNDKSDSKKEPDTGSSDETTLPATANISDTDAKADIDTTTSEENSTAEVTTVNNEPNAADDSGTTVGDNSNASNETSTESNTTDSADSANTIENNNSAQDQKSVDQNTTAQTDSMEDTVSEDDNDPKKIRIDKVADSTNTTIPKARVYFPYSSSKKADLTGSATRYFDQVVAALKADKNLKIQLTGHTDNQGKAKNNQSLGLRRAETVKRIFIEKGVNKEQIETASKGENSPIASNKTEAGRNKNRRVTVEAIQTTE